MAVPEAGDSDVARAAADLDLLARRLGALSSLAWESRRAPVWGALADLVAIAARVEGRDLEPPDLPDYSLADGLTVIAHDLLTSARSNADVVASVGAVLRRLLAETR